MEQLERIRELIATLADLDDEQLEELSGLIEDAREWLLSDENAERDDDEFVGWLSEVADYRQKVADEGAAREERKAERKAEADRLRDAIRNADEDPEPDPDTETDPAPDTETEAEPEGKKTPVAAATGRRAAPATVKRTADTKPAAVPVRAALTAAAGVPGVETGVDLSDPFKLGKAIIETWRAGVGYQGGRHTVRVAQASYDFPEERILDDNVAANMRKIEEAVRPRRAVTAAGGICAPAPIDYSMPVIGTSARPIRDALPNFGASRGAVRTITPPTIETVAGIGAGNVQGSGSGNSPGGGVSIWTESNDQSPASPATKPCLTITCGADTTTAVDAITQCLATGNFRDRYFPESVAAWVSLQDTWTARVAEQNLLAKIAAGSTTLTTGVGIQSTARDVLAALDRYVSAVRYWYRLPVDVAFRVLAPVWLLDNMRTDLARELPGATAERLAMADAQLTQFFSSRGFNMSYILEGESSQRFGRPIAGAIPPWPSHVFLYVFLEGTWVYLNGGTLNLGVVRDSTLNATNNFQMFSEVFEQVHFHGTFSHKLDIDICPAGTTSAAASFNPCTSGS